MLHFSMIFMIWSRIRKIIPFVGIAIFVYLLVKLNIFEILKQIKNVNLFYIFLAVAFTFVYFLFQTTKWYIIARKQGMRVPFKDALRINLITDFYGFITPVRLGSAMRADYLKNYGSLGKGFSNFVIDKVLDLSSVFILAILLGFIFRERIGITSSNMLYILITIFLAMVLVFLVFYKKEFSRFFLRIIYRKFVPKKTKDKVKTTFDSFYEGMPSLKFLFFVLIVNLSAWVVNYSIAYFVGLSLGINVGFIYYLAIFPIATLIAQIPITISGLGTREFTLIGLFGLFGVEAVKVFSMALIGLFITSIIPALFAVFFILRERK